MGSVPVGIGQSVPCWHVLQNDGITGHQQPLRSRPPDRLMMKTSEGIPSWTCLPSIEVMPWGVARSIAPMVE